MREKGRNFTSNFFQVQRGDELDGRFEPIRVGRLPDRPEDGHRLRILLQQPDQARHHRRHTLNRALRIQLQDLRGSQKEETGGFLLRV